MEKTTEQKYFGNFDEVFPIIDPSKLIGHKLLEHYPIGERQKSLINNIRRGIELDLPAFRAPCMDPSEENGKIVFKSGNRPAGGHSPVWWDETWKTFMPSKNSRSGTELHYAAFLGKLMKYLIEEMNYSVKDAWRAVCDDSRELGHYWNSKGAKYDFEPTGSRKIGEHSDFANTCKIIKRWEFYGFFLASGNCGNDSHQFPLARCYVLTDLNLWHNSSVGWLVLDV